MLCVQSSGSTYIHSIPQTLPLSSSKSFASLWKDHLSAFGLLPDCKTIQLRRGEILSSSLKVQIPGPLTSRRFWKILVLAPEFYGGKVQCSKNIFTYSLIILYTYIICFDQVQPPYPYSPVPPRSPPPTSLPVAKTLNCISHTQYSQCKWDLHWEYLIIVVLLYVGYPSLPVALHSWGTCRKLSTKVSDRCSAQSGWQKRDSGCPGHSQGSEHWAPACLTHAAAIESRVCQTLGIFQTFINK